MSATFIDYVYYRVSMRNFPDDRRFKYNLVLKNADKRFMLRTGSAITMF